MGKQFAPIYTDVILDFMLNREDALLKTMLCVAQFVGPYGTGYIGQNRMRDYVGRSWNTIRACLLELSERDLIRAHVSIERGRKITTYQISPHAIFLREACTFEALAMWEEAQSLEIVMSEDAPEYSRETSRETSRKTSSYKSTTTSENEAFSGAGDVSQQAHAVPAQTAKTQKQKQKPQKPIHPAQNATPAPSAQTEAPPDSAPPPPRLSDIYRNPLATKADEDMAQILHAWGTRLAQARHIVATHGHEAVGKGVNHIKAERKRGVVIKSPIGLLTKWLERQQIVPDDKMPHDATQDDSPSTEHDLNDGRRYAMGEYAAFFETDTEAGVS